MKTLIAIKGCEAHFDRFTAELNTWIRGKHWNLVWYFTGPMLGVPDDYDSLPAKTKAICQWAVNNEYDYAFLTDTDTYVSVPRLLASRFYLHDYTGYVLDWLPTHYCSGPGYWLSRKAMKILAEADWSKISGHGHETCEDVMVGAVLHAHGILPHHDRRYALYEDVLPENDVISSHLSSRKAFEISFMYEAHKPWLSNSRADAETRCSSTPMAQA